MINEEELYIKTIVKWGRDAQIGIAIEELAELIVKLVKYGRNVNGSTREEVLEEMADVEIMIGQLKHIFGDTMEIRGRKLMRLEERLSK